jgi:glutaredoxin
MKGVDDDDDVQPILSYLFKTYGNGNLPWTMQNKIAQFAKRSATLGLAGRNWFTSVPIASDPPELPLTLWAYESSPFCKVVTETLGQLGVTYTVIYTPRGSTNRQLLLDRFGRFQVPFLQDPNTGVELWESQAICEYLQAQYGQSTTVSYL